MTHLLDASASWLITWVNLERFAFKRSSRMRRLRRGLQFWRCSSWCTFAPTRRSRHNAGSRSGPLSDVAERNRKRGWSDPGRSRAIEDQRDWRRNCWGFRQRPGLWPRGGDARRFHAEN